MNPAAAAYENAHVTSLEAQLSRAVDSCMRLRPADPAAYIGVRLISASAVAESPTTPHPATEAVASEPSADAVTSEWKTVSWLDSEETNRELAAAMLGQSFVTGGDSYRTPLSSHLTARRREAEGASTLRVGRSKAPRSHTVTIPVSPLLLHRNELTTRTSADFSVPRLAVFSCWRTLFRAFLQKSKVGRATIGRNRRRRRGAASQFSRLHSPWPTPPRAPRPPPTAPCQS